MQQAPELRARTAQSLRNKLDYIWRMDPTKLEKSGVSRVNSARW